MREYAPLAKLSTILGFPADGKRLGRTLVEIGIRERNGKPTADSIRRLITKKNPRLLWVYDVNAVTVRVFGGYIPDCAAQEACAIAAELAAIDRTFNLCESSVSKLIALGDRWEMAIKSMRPAPPPAPCASASFWARGTRLVGRGCRLSGGGAGTKSAFGVPRDLAQPHFPNTSLASRSHPWPLLDWSNSTRPPTLTIEV